MIEARDLKTHFRVGGGVFTALAGQKPQVARALDGVDLTIRAGEVVGLVGESGCGKSTLGMTLVRMVEPTGGEILHDGQPITGIAGARLKAYRARAQIIFQDPYSSLNPRLTVGRIVGEALQIHGIGTRADRTERMRDALRKVRLPPEEFEDRFPSDLSGGQRQRVAIARGLVLDPSFIVADEPVSMLDVSVQAGVLELLDELSRNLGLAVLYISHDIATVGYICDRVAVMYLGRVVEEGPVRTILRHPKHPYTQRLMAAIPNVDPLVRRPRVVLEGDVPSPLNVPAGCRFVTRCPYAQEICRRAEPDLLREGDGRTARCHLYGALAGTPVAAEAAKDAAAIAA
ncbi:ATP-binding cassette domain-containing protein [Paracoccus sp. S-4012]|nr:ABC transporter ATP-binding protein [Paracoccus sp. S-4012]MRX50549.1 ATP-binding cassette domain-containing protein [Paracoccus sp. S-4012]